ncbi:D-2-hydroxyacid dehydrogenase [Candidatus Xianfuyuplasma coldseepsis]|uniref:3-phosphoglycerate dehydrogenase n=1 Tax=Candidatus Xianfuyuplasma coldseepsis TaxID=2782163 RepID=A0A7L7KP62_9MOLU|nr:D-2-hydroxyacid dehydrogenase [Xianfuyuplasma coldseepsis]QMS84199.1 3-phosphoglycerate dehydrogenase [Xianfuyuplasma coldseepsis]
MIKILANDGIDHNAKLELESLGYVVDTTHYDGAELHEQLQQVDCIIVRSATKIRTVDIDQALLTKKLRLIIRAGVGIDNIDHEYAENHGILVRNTPNSSSDAVAELAIGHMFAIARHIYHANVTMRQGQWHKKQYKGIELSGKTLGLVGFGRIAQKVAEKAMALGMKVIYNDIRGQQEVLPQCKEVCKDDLLQQSDFISLHIPFKPEMGPYLGEEEFSKMKPGMYIVHTARGGVVDETALLNALDNHTVAFAALDVYEEEPTKNERIYTHERISLTPHIGASTIEAQARIGLETIAVIQEILS